MIIRSSGFQYKAFGLLIESEFALPECVENESAMQADVFIRHQDLSALWECHAKPHKLFVCTEQFVLFKVPDTAIFCVEEGCKISVSPFSGTDINKLRLYILGTCMGIVLMQRQILPLHGSALLIDDKVFAIVGDSGAGKSTLASVLMQKGYAMLSDDVIAVTMNDRNDLLVHPSYPQQKLWKDSLQKLSMRQEGLSPLFDRENKFSVPVHDRFCNEAKPLAGVIELKRDQKAEVSLRNIQGLERLALLHRHTYRGFILERIGLLQWHFKLLSRIAGRVQIKQMCRPNEGFSANEIAELLIQKCNDADKSA